MFEQMSDRMFEGNIDGIVDRMFDQNADRMFERNFDGMLDRMINGILDRMSGFRIGRKPRE